MVDCYDWFLILNNTTCTLEWDSLIFCSFAWKITDVSRQYDSLASENAKHKTFMVSYESLIKLICITPPANSTNIFTGRKSIHQYLLVTAGLPRCWGISPGVIRWETGYILDRFSVHYRVAQRTNNNSKVIFFFLKREYLQPVHAGEHGNSIHVINFVKNSISIISLIILKIHSA